MNLRKALSKDTIALELKSADKNSIIEELIDLLVAAGKITDRKAALKVVMDREKKISTGMQNGIAIPHAKSEKIDCLVAALGIKKEGVDFGSLDGQPSRIFVLTISPAKRAGPHIQFLAEISRVLNNDVSRERILNAASKEEMIEILGNGGATRNGGCQDAKSEYE